MRKFLISLCFGGLLGMLFSCSEDDNAIAEPDLYDATTIGDSLYHDTGLPVINIRTFDGEGIKSKDTWIAATFSVWTPDGSWSLGEAVQIKGRGNATWKFPKKPFNIKFSRKYSMLGMPKHKRWVFLANYHDRTLLRNALTFHLGAMMEGLEWTPRFQFAEVIFNGHHVGNYLVCEQIRVDPARVNIDEMNADDVDGESLTGGYLLNFDAYYDEINRFKTPQNKWPVGIKSPDDGTIRPEQIEYIKSFVYDCEIAMLQRHYDALQTSFLDYRSFVDYYIIQTLTGNKELKKPRSVYVYKKRNGRMYAGPLWDFDFSTYRNVEANLNNAALWYKFLFKDPAFVALLKDRWKEVEPVLRQELVEYLDSMQGELEFSQSLNFQVFPIRNDIVNKYENGDEELPYGSAVERMKGVALRRIDKMDAFLSDL